MKGTYETPYGKLRTTTKRRFALVDERSDGTGPYAWGYTDNPESARRRVRAASPTAVAVDLAAQRKEEA